jgi:uncharacterized protein
MHIIVYKVLKDVQEKGLPGSHHFFISFVTKNAGVKISKNLLNKYPREMTIVLQYQYQDLHVDPKGFTVTLSFGGVKEKIYIPFSAITTFADPSVQFGLQFREGSYQDESQNEIDIEIDDNAFVSEAPKKGAKKKSKEDNNVISLDKYRSKK